LADGLWRGHWISRLRLLPATYPGWTSGARLSAALATALLFFVSLIAHELGHHLVAKRFGLSSPHITLSVFGGLSGLGRDPERPRDEFLIAASGPLVSFLLALGFGLLAWAGPDRVGLPLAAFSTWLGLANLTLALFNLLPGFSRWRVDAPRHGQGSLML
jgi:Zn-dependent protease